MSASFSPSSSSSSSSSSPLSAAGSKDMADPNAACPQAGWIVQPFDPIYDADSRVLILGSLPSVASRENGFYYGHPRNRFWMLLANLFHQPLPQSIEEKKALLLGEHIALYDAIYACSIEGSSDASIKNAQPADLSSIFKTGQIRAVLCNGAAARKALAKNPNLPGGIPVCTLPSTSPANAAFSLQKLEEKWGEAFQEIGMLPEKK